MRRFLTVVLVLVGLLVGGRRAEAQEIQLTGPLAGAPAVRAMRLRRQNRFEIAPAVSFTLLDEYQRTILVGGRLTYNFTDWLGFGVWGAAGAVKTPTALSDNINQVTQNRRNPNAAGGESADSVNNRLVQFNVGRDFKKQLGTIQWVVAPQITLVPFRGKLAIFQKIFVDTDAFVFGGPAFVGLQERADCTATCNDLDEGYKTATRMQIAPTFGLGLSFYMSHLINLGLEWRGLPFAWNTGGFDNRGGNPDGRFPDRQISSQDREFKFNQMLTVSLGFSLPSSVKPSE